jgi:hypothetical protein
MSGTPEPDLLLDLFRTRERVTLLAEAWIASLPDGAQPTIEIVRDSTVPKAGQPASGWYMKSATLTSRTFATGQVTLTIEDGAKLLVNPHAIDGHCVISHVYYND